MHKQQQQRRRQAIEYLLWLEWAQQKRPNGEEKPQVAAAIPRKKTPGCRVACRVV